MDVPAWLAEKMLPSLLQSTSYTLRLVATDNFAGLDLQVWVPACLDKII